MMNRSIIKNMLLCLTMLAYPGEQAFASLMGGGGSRVVEPSSEAPPLPDEMPQSQPVRLSSIPPLPISRSCKQPDLEGLWRLLRVYEEPTGNEMAAFIANPVQYVYYRPDGVYGKYNGDGALAAAEQIIEHIDRHATGLQQYLLQYTGMIYYYQDKVATTSQTCFIVSKPRESFLPGEMLLIPPKGQLNGRLIKEYTKVPLTPVQSATPTANKGQNAGAAPAGVVSDGAVNPLVGHRTMPGQPLDPNDPGQ